MTKPPIQNEIISKEDNNHLQPSNYWTVPICTVTDHDLPRVFLGDHGFLSKYGSKLKIKEVEERMLYALSQASVGLAAGDEICLRATRHITCNTIQKPCVLYHTDVALVVGSRRAHFGRCMSSLLQAVRTWAPKFVEDDLIVGSFLKYFATYRPYSDRETTKLMIAERAWEKERERIHRFKPAIITVGGDYLDFALAVGRFDIALSALMLYQQLCQQLGILLVMTSYTGYYTIGSEQANLLSNLYDAIMVPINSKGVGMLPDRTNLLSWAHHLGKPIIAMHPLGSGQVDVRQGLSYVLDEAKAMATVVGASTYEHIDEFIKSGRAVVGEKKFSAFQCGSKDSYL